jgi:hypothetical protein
MNWSESMIKLKQVLATLAATGLVVAGPALAETRASGSLPASSVQLDPARVARASAPAVDADELGAGLSPAIILAFLAVIAAVVAVAGGGGGGGPDSPG